MDILTCVDLDSLDVLWFNWRDIKNPDAGGAELFTHEVARRWAAEGHNVTLFTSKFPGCREEEVVDGIRIIRDGGRYTVYWRARRNYENRFRNEGYDVVIDEINTRPFMTPRFVDGGEVILGLIHQLAREYWFYETPFPISLIGYHFLEKRWLRNYIDIPMVTVSESTRRDLHSLGLRNVSVVPEGLSTKPLDSLPEKEEKPTMIFVGRMKKAKLPDHAIEAYRIVSKQIPDAQLWMVGEGYLKERLKAGAPAGVRFFDNISDEEKFDLLRRAHVLVMPGLREGWGLVVTEANALGTPAVAYDVPGLRDSVRNNVTGVLVPFGKVEKLSRETIRLLKDEELRERLSKNALERSRDFSWNSAAREFMQIIVTKVV
ncbi:glycosyltransferase family 4 protein [Candidatus Bathyarchaeota archaeon]|nr:glycosyltransferase family 4 protein [Candidatus Bathyarchaeota archaeon]